MEEAVLHEAAAAMTQAVAGVRRSAAAAVMKRLTAMNRSRVWWVCRG